MEYALWEANTIALDLGYVCLNPCFNGICSLRSLYWYGTD